MVSVPVASRGCPMRLVSLVCKQGFLPSSVPLFPPLPFLLKIFYLLLLSFGKVSGKPEFTRLPAWNFYILVSSSLLSDLEGSS